jgi:hypothetical protein
MLSRLTLLMQQVTKEMVCLSRMLIGEMVPAALCMHQLALLQRCCMHMSLPACLGVAGWVALSVTICIDHHWSSPLSIGV